MRFGGLLLVLDMAFSELLRVFLLLATNRVDNIYWCVKTRSLHSTARYDSPVVNQH